MSSLRGLSARAVRSLYASVLIATLLILCASFLVFKSIASQMQKTKVDTVYDRMDRLEIENARNHLQQGGKPNLRAYMLSLDRIFGGVHSLLDQGGRDVLTGEDKSNLLPPLPTETRRGVFNGRWTLAHRSPDGLFWLTAVAPTDHPQPWMFLPYYFLAIGTTGLLWWLVAVRVVSPLRRIATGIAQFGHGDLATRVTLTREDEIGQLARSFNQMAERLGLLIESERTLLSDISHELRSPLARLKVAAKLARNPDYKGASLDRIEQDIDRLTSILSDVVELTVVEGDPALKETDEVDLQQVVETVVMDCEIEAKQRDCAVMVYGALGTPVEGNLELLRRAIENVLRNAVRYAPDGSVICLSLSEEHGNATISVRDYGAGVPDAALSRIFDPFFRVESSRDARSGGSGLGLSIAKRAIKLHRGEISAHNASPGLRVDLIIPMHAADAQG